MLTNHDRRMIVALIVAIAISFSLPWFVGPIQLLVCSFALYFKLKKICPNPKPNPTQDQSTTQKSAK